MKHALFTLGLLVVNSAMGQTRNGGISAEMLQQIEQQNPPTVSDRALRNALAANAIDLLAKNHQHGRDQVAVHH